MKAMRPPKLPDLERLAQQLAQRLDAHAVMNASGARSIGAVRRVNPTVLHARLPGAVLDGFGRVLRASSATVSGARSRRSIVANPPDPLARPLVHEPLLFSV